MMREQEARGVVTAPRVIIGLAVHSRHMIGTDRDVTQATCIVPAGQINQSDQTALATRSTVNRQSEAVTGGGR